MNQVWVPYHEWEDWINGMWSRAKNETEDIERAIEFTGDHIRYGSVMRRVINEWPRCMLNALTNPSINQRAFLGHCAVCLELGIPEYITRAAWKQLTDTQRYEADKVAQETIDQWKRNYERQNKRIHRNMGASLLS